jgi:hypothetical protein
MSSDHGHNQGQILLNGSTTDLMKTRGVSIAPNRHNFVPTITHDHRYLSPLLLIPITHVLSCCYHRHHHRHHSCFVHRLHLCFILLLLLLLLIIPTTIALHHLLHLPVIHRTNQVQGHAIAAAAIALLLLLLRHDIIIVSITSVPDRRINKIKEQNSEERCCCCCCLYIYMGIRPYTCNARSRSFLRSASISRTCLSCSAWAASSSRRYRLRRLFSVTSRRML